MRNLNRILAYKYNFEMRQHMLNLKLKAAVIALSHLETGLTVEIIVMM